MASGNFFSKFGDHFFGEHSIRWSTEYPSFKSRVDFGKQSTPYDKYLRSSEKSSAGSHSWRTLWPQTLSTMDLSSIVELLKTASIERYPETKSGRLHPVSKPPQPSASFLDHKFSTVFKPLSRC